MKRILLFFTSLAILAVACGGNAVSGPSGNVSDVSPLEVQATAEMVLLANAGIFNDFASQPGGVPVNMHTEKGSVELKLEIQSISADHPSRVHAYITADPFFMPGTAVREKKPIMMSLTTLVVDRTKAQALGWAENLRMIDVVNAAREGKLKVCAASASQDAAALNFFLSAMTAIKGEAATLRTEDLNLDTPIVAAMEDFYAVMVKGAYNSDFLRQSVLSERMSGQTTCDAVVLPESSAIALDRDLTAAGKEPMQIFYIADATSVQIYTMGCVDKINADKTAQCQALEKYLQSPAVQAKIVNLGFRANDVGYAVPGADPTVFNADWGVRTDEPLAVDMPKDTVVEQAINLYQTALRPGSYTVYCLDYSGSMEGDGQEQLLVAMKLMLDQTEASRYLLQASPKDTTYVIAFAGNILAENMVQGNDPGQFTDLYGQVERQELANSTNIYGCAIRALEVAQANASDDQLPAVILLTDGQHNGVESYGDLKSVYSQMSRPIPVYAILFGFAVEEELRSIANLTNGSLCDGHGGQEALARCFRTFKGNN